MKLIQRWKMGAGGFIGEVSLFELDYWDEYVSATVRTRCVMLSNLHVHPLRRSRGWGAELVRAALAHAQKHQWSVFIRVVPYSGAPLNADALIAFYHRHGFRTLMSDDREMLWQPRSTKAKQKQKSVSRR